MKKIILLILGVFLAGGLIYGFLFYQRNLTGLGPALSNPGQSIVNLLQSPQPGENSTKFPLSLPNTSHISIFADNLGGNPRVLAFDQNKHLATSLTDTGKILALPEKTIIAQDLKHPHGILFKNSKMYIAEENQLSVFDYEPGSLKATNKTKLVSLPNPGLHYTRTLLLSPDQQKILISVGSTCNVCSEDDHARILSVNFDGSDLKPYATGLRNSVFMTYRPGTTELWATEMGRDLLGDNTPPDEINIIKEGSNYGWPICYGQNTHDDSFDHKTYIRNPCEEPFEIPSQIDLPAHSAPLGLAFLDKNTLLISFHGSWNRSVPTGYKIAKITLDNNGKQTKIEDFVSGWLQSDNTTLGRPVDLLLDGTKIYISDDKASLVYLLQL